MRDLPSYTELLDTVANAALFGSLGLFVGSGFSKALNSQAPSFQSLLESACSELDLNFDFNDADLVRGKSYPQIAEELAEILTDEDTRPYADASLDLKRVICNLCDIKPTPAKARRFSSALQRIPIQWAITTNYDFILENLIPNSVPLLPNQFLNSRPDYIPIYHLHGHVRSPSSIVITDSDYVRLLAPTEYRQLKLNLLLAESTSLMMGYSLGDINVKNALEWSRAFSTNWGLEAEPHQSLVVQALFKPAPDTMNPYFGKNGEVIVEMHDILTFLTEISEVVEARRSEHDESKELLKSWLVSGRAESVADDPSARQEFLDLLGRFPRSYDVQTVIRFLESVFDPIWESARETGGWEHYDRFLQVLFDALKAIPVVRIHPLLLSYLAERLDEISYFVNPRGEKELGTSFAASKSWQRRKDELPEEMRKALCEFGRDRSRQSLLALLGC
jgi:hypothetical protein